MIEVKIPVDVASLQVKNTMGLTPKTRTYAIIGILTIMPLSIFGSRIMHQDLANFLIMVIMAIICIPIYLERGGKTGETGEEMFLNIVYWHLSKRKRPYVFTDVISEMDEQEQAEKLEQQQQGKKKRKRQPAKNRKG